MPTCYFSPLALENMMMPSSGIVFRVTGPWCGEFTAHRWIPITKASDSELWCFLWSVPEKNGLVNNSEAGDLRRHSARYNVIVMYCTRVEPLTQIPHPIANNFLVGKPWFITSFVIIPVTLMRNGSLRRQLQTMLSTSQLSFSRHTQMTTCIFGMVSFGAYPVIGSESR